MSCDSEAYRLKRCGCVSEIEAYLKANEISLCLIDSDCGPIRILKLNPRQKSEVGPSLVKAKRSRLAYRRNEVYLSCQRKDVGVLIKIKTFLRQHVFVAKESTIKKRYN